MTNNLIYFLQPSQKRWPRGGAPPSSQASGTSMINKDYYLLKFCERLFYNIWCASVLRRTVCENGN